MEPLVRERGFLPAVYIPMDLDAFILNNKVCDTGPVRIAPVTQPDYHGLRPDNAEIRADILPPVDVHRTQPASLNARISATETTDFSVLDPSQPEKVVTPPLRTNRVGVHLHWSLPRLYRAATAAADGTKPPRTNQNASANPTFRPVPNRWLVARSIKSSTPAVPKDKQVTGWVVESDRLWNVDELGPDVDLETDVSPYVNYTSSDETSPNILNKQAAVYIGEKIPVETWTERGTAVPRVPLTAMNSSNFSFADNTMHNANVFSMIDNLEAETAEGKKFLLRQANCQYIVIGWHSDQESDPLGVNPDKATMVDRLLALFCKLDEKTPADYLASRGATRLLSFGTIYDVRFDRSKKPDIPAEKFADLFTSSVNMEPVSVGTTGLDAILSFLEAHKDGADSIAREILNLSELLYASEDSYDSRVKAADLIYAHNFQPTAAGNSWQYDGKAPPGGAPAQPNAVDKDANGKTEVDYLIAVNDLQFRLDAATRKLRHTRWALFAVWWKFVSEPNNADTALRQSYQTQVEVLRKQLVELVDLISNPTTGLHDQIEVIVRKDKGTTLPPLVQGRRIPQPTFFQKSDPTLCIAGMDSGWDPRYLGTIPARFITDRKYQSSVNAEKIGDVRIAEGISFLLQQALSVSDHSAEIGFKKWSGQPWVPLFIEWEAIYFDIAFEKWSLQILNSPIGNNHAQVRYGVKEPLADDPSNLDDQRVVAGRIILLPQPSVNLKALVEQIIDTPGVALTPEQKQELLDNVGKLKFASSDISGLTSNLLTLFEGSHVQPNLRVPGEANGIPLLPGITTVTPIGMLRADIRRIAGETAQTPYGNLVDFSQAAYQPFKGVTHGQLYFTKMNIVDKFGQVISGIDPDPPLFKPTQLPKTMYPCLGDQVCPGILEGTNHLNTVAPLTEADPHFPSGYPLCPFVQLTPAINQATRINLDFLLPTGSGEAFSGWKAAEDWDQPAWGWIIINYADYGLQFFTSDGTFYIELSLGGPMGSIARPKWLPFDPPKNNSLPVSPQLVELIGKMTEPVTGPAYLQALYEVVVDAVETMPYAPADYAAYSTSIVGKPLALVNVGVSLELALPPLESQSTRPPSRVPTTLSPADILFSYKFPIKIGDKERPFDGMVGYFDTENDISGATTWDTFYTYFPASGATPSGDPRAPILPEDFPTISPYYVDPIGPLNNGSFRASHATKYLVKTMLIDPFTSTHIYNPILPIKSLRMPAWAVQRALQKMSAFFHLGPILVSRDVRSTYDEAHPLEADTWVETQKNIHTQPDTAALRLPIRAAGSKAVWSWLQPYPVDGEDGEKARRYNALDVGEDDGKLRLDPAPYTSIEGFLLLTKPLGSTDS